MKIQTRPVLHDVARETNCRPDRVGPNSCETVENDVAAVFEELSHREVVQKDDRLAPLYDEVVYDMATQSIPIVS